MNYSKLCGLMACFAVMSLVSCQDEDYGYTTSEIKSAKYAKDFRNFFGDIDPEQDWNLATRGSVSVTATPGSEIKVYAKMDGTYKIVGDYENFSGNETLNFDMLEETTDILVTDGMQSAYAKVGESVYLSGTRTAYPTGSTVTVAPDYKDFDFSYVSAVTDLLTEDADNLGKVTENFSYISTGAFTIYPIYWNTSSVHTMGVYYKDGSGNYHTIPFYDTRVGNELALKEYKDGTKCEDRILPFVGAIGKEWPNPTITKVEGGKGYYSGQIMCTDYFYGNGMKCSAGTHTIEKVTNDWQGDHYWYSVPENQYVEEFCNWKSYQVGDICEHGYKITKIENGAPYHLRTHGECTHDNSHTWAVGDHCCMGHEIAGFKDGGKYYNGYVEWTGTVKPVVGTTSEQGQVIDYIDQYGNAYYNSTVVYNYKSTFAGNAAFSDGKTVGSKGITINLPAGTQFGFYLDVYDGESYADDGMSFTNHGTFYHTVYSQADVNKEFAGKTTMTGKTPNSGSGWKGQNVKGTYVFGSTFTRTVNDKEVKYVCFEDWNLSGPDLQDIVFVIDGDTPPVVVDEDAKEWVICGEDLGGTFDLDYNDVVVSIAHVSGKTTADFTALAAGGTLASYVYFNGTCLGEIHELLGAQNAKSGDFSPINVNGSVGRTVQRTLSVDGHFSIATVENGNSMNANMGGFQIRVVPIGEASTENNAVVKGQVIQDSWVNISQNVPYVFCVPRSWDDDHGVKKSFRWPNELQPVDDYNGKQGAYDVGNNGHNFSNWISKKDKNQWFKSPVNNLTTGF